MFLGSAIWWWYPSPWGPWLLLYTDHPTVNVWKFDPSVPGLSLCYQSCQTCCPDIKLRTITRLHKPSSQREGETPALPNQPQSQKEIKKKVWDKAMEMLVRAISCNVRHFPRDQKREGVQAALRRQHWVSAVPWNLWSRVHTRTPIIPLKNLPLSSFCYKKEQQLFKGLSNLSYHVT